MAREVIRMLSLEGEGTVEEPAPIPPSASTAVPDPFARYLATRDRLFPSSSSSGESQKESGTV